MFVVDRLILVAALLLLVGIASSKFSARLGLPVLVLFIGVGMLAGSEGIGGIHFEDYGLAHGIASLALAFILFDGGLRTSSASLRAAWRPAVALASAGVLVTAGITGVAAAWILDIDLMHGLLLGSIVGSTDAAAVFSVLRSQGLRLPTRLVSTLEIESGSNDPMAIFLTIGFLQVLTQGGSPGPAMLVLFVQQFGIGALAGVGTGLLARWVINRIDLGAAGLYPVLTGSFGLLAFGLAAWIGGSGFLAIYLTGIVLGNSRIVFQRGTLIFFDGVAWVSQIAMFVILGLLSFPSRLLQVAPQALAIAAVLILLARPISVVLCLAPFRFGRRALTFVTWGGLRGAVPIVLSTFPLLYGLPAGALLFDVVFFVVLVSAITQGWSLPAAARRLGLLLPSLNEPPIMLEINSLRELDADIVQYPVGPKSPACGRRVRDLAFPEGVVVALIARGQKAIPPGGSTPIEQGDHLVVVVRRDARAAVDKLLGAAVR